MSHAPRILVAGLDVARALRDDGFEAIDVGDGLDAQALVSAAIDEDVEAVCVPAGSGGDVAAELSNHDVRIAVIDVLDLASVAGAVRAAIQ